MKLLTLFSAVLLLSSTGVNTTMAFQQVAYAETESLSEGGATIFWGGNQ